ncbi:MAG: hypothetical protein Aurels2KO_01520 [Aureliella sp.]
MKRSTLLCQMALVGAIGCSGPAPAPGPGSSPVSAIEMPDETQTITSEDGTAITWVRLKVPNMH